MNEINVEVKKILENYFNYSKFTMYTINKKRTIVSEKTIKNILENSNRKIMASTIKKITKFPDLKIEDLKKLNELLKKSKKDYKKKVCTQKIEINEELVLKIFDDVIFKKYLENFDFNKAQSYFETRKINSINSAVGSRTLLGKKIWELNDVIFEKLGDIKMLLDVTPKDDKIQMKKGLLSVAKNLKAIANELEENAVPPEKSETDIIINFEED